MAGKFFRDHLVVARQSALQQKAAGWMTVGIGRHADDAVEEQSCGCACGRGVEHFSEETFAALLVTIEHGAEETFLAAEAGVETGRVDVHRRRQVCQRRAFVTLAPEHIHGAVERVLHAESAGSPFTHSSLPVLFLYRMVHNDLARRRPDPISVSFVTDMRGLPCRTLLNLYAPTALRLQQTPR